VLPPSGGATDDGWSRAEVSSPPGAADTPGPRRSPHSAPEPPSAPDGAEATLDQVLAHGGWLLVDPRPTAAAHPDTFAMPSAEELAALGPGSGVKVIFRLADLTDSVRDRVLAHGLDEPPRLCTVTERMWLVVVRRQGDLLTCVLDNQPYAAYSRLVVGAEVTVPVAYVIATGAGPDDLAGYLAQNDENGLPRLPESETTRPEDPRRWPSIRADQSEVCRRAGVWPAPAWMFASMLVARDLSPEREPVVGARFHAEPDRGDCGWVVFAGYESMDEVAKGPGFDVVTVQQACARDRRILRYLALPEGWGFTAGSGGDHVHPAEIEE